MKTAAHHNSTEEIAQSCDIAIVGGGMVGVTLALMLAKASAQRAQPWSITLIEHFPFPAKPIQKNSAAHSQAAQPSFDARSTALSAGSMEVFNDLGCASAIKAQATAIQKIHVSDKGHYNGTLLAAQDYAVDALGYVVENRFLGQCLLAELQQSSVHCLAPATVEGCELKQHGAVLSITQDDKTSSLNAGLVLIADGAESTLRQSLGIDIAVTHYEQSAIIANIALAKPHGGIAYERFTDQGPLAILPLPDCRLDNVDSAYRASLVWTRDSQQVDELMQASDEFFLQQLQQCFGYRVDKMIHVGERHVYPLQLVQATEQVRSRIAVVGNAAHFLHPVAGQGFNLSIRDCVTLVDTLSEASAESLGSYSTLERYQQRREMDQQLTMGLTDGMVNLFSSTALSKMALRQMGLFSLNALPLAKGQLAKQMMGLM